MTDARIAAWGYIAGSFALFVWQGFRPLVDHSPTFTILASIAVGLMTAAIAVVTFGSRKQ